MCYTDPKSVSIFSFNAGVAKKLANIDNASSPWDQVGELFHVHQRHTVNI